jgi:hypothetical protein
VIPGPRLKVKSAILKELVIGLCLIPFVLGGLFFAVGMLEEWWLGHDLAKHKRISTLSGGRGPVLYAGDARRASVVTSPSGAKGIAWVATVGYIAHGKKTSWFEPVCTRADVSELSLGDGLSSLRLTFAAPNDAVTLASHSGLKHSESPQVDLGEVGAPSPNAEIPASIRSSCGEILSQKSASALLYREAVLRDGQHLEVIGCTSDGATLVPCKDGLDLVTVAPLDQRIAAEQRGTAIAVLFGGMWNLIVCAILAAVLSERLVKAKLSVAEAARRTP